MFSQNPLVSIIIPAYNAERFIAETLESVLNQTHQHLEILVVDDGSTDSTADIVRDYVARDSRFALLQQRNAGVAAARNRGICEARGEFIAPVDADDIWFSECIKARLALMAEPEVGMVYAWSVFIDEEGNLLKTCQSNLWEGNDYIPLIYRNLPGNASCVLLRRSFVQEVGGYDPGYRNLKAQGCEDWDLYLRLAQHCETRVVPRLLIGYRQVDGSMSSNPEPMRRGVDLILDRFAARHPEVDPAIYSWNRSNFSWYLAQKCSRLGDHECTLRYMGRALSLDYFPLFRVNFYRLGIMTVLKILVRPVTSSIWPDHHTWLNSKKKWAAFWRSVNPFYQEVTLTGLQRKQLVAKKRFPWRQFEQFMTWRCDFIRQQAQQRLSASLIETPPIAGNSIGAVGKSS